MSFLRKQESRFIPAEAGTQQYGAIWNSFMFWIPACAGMADKTPSPGQPVGWPASPSRGEAGCFIRLKCYGIRMERSSPPPANRSFPKRGIC